MRYGRRACVAHARAMSLYVCVTTPSRAADERPYGFGNNLQGIYLRLENDFSG